MLIDMHLYAGGCWPSPIPGVRALADAMDQDRQRTDNVMFHLCFIPTKCSRPPRVTAEKSAHHAS